MWEGIVTLQTSFVRRCYHPIQNRSWFNSKTCRGPIRSSQARDFGAVIKLNANHFVFDFFVLFVLIK